MEFQAVNKNYFMTENQACAGKQKNSDSDNKKAPVSRSLSNLTMNVKNQRHLYMNEHFFFRFTHFI